MRTSVLAFALAAAVAAQAPTSIVSRISASSLRGRTSFLASDLLEGRDTPSRGLDIAAGYIASEFRRAGLEGPQDYFQNAEFTVVTNSMDGFGLAATAAKQSDSVEPERAHVTALHGVHLSGVPIFKWSPDVKVRGSLEGKVLMLRKPSEMAVIGNLELAKPEAIVVLVRQLDSVSKGPLLEPAGKHSQDQPPIIDALEADLERVFDRLPNGNGPGRVTLFIPDPVVNRVALHNVIGVLPGSDPELQKQVVLITAHYDHLGLAASSETHRVYNGANDNASGVATLIELAHAFGREESRPRRTLVFMALFGEEKGLLGSAYYLQHPLFPLARTVADINFEQLGKPNADDNLKSADLGVTGYEYSDLPARFGAATPPAGVHVLDTNRNHEFYSRSDNYSFAQAGIPAHTFVAAYDFPDYHRVTDTWDKLDYDNMAKLDAAIALGILDLANRDETPHWSEASPEAKPFLRAWNELHSR